MVTALSAITGSNDVSGVLGNAALATPSTATGTSASSFADVLSGVSSTASTGSSASGGSFASAVGGVVDGLSGLQSTANSLAVKAVTGDLTDIHQATLAATRAQVTMELVSAVRNKGVDAFNEIMRMQA